jgi:peptidoglycan-associated lipoprotein
MKSLVCTSLILLLIASCTLTENIQDGQTAWDLKKYGLAAELLQKDFRKEDPLADKGALAFQIARCYQFTNQPEEAAEWFKTAIEWEYGSDAILQYAYMLKRLEKYNDAIAQFNRYIKAEPYKKPEITIEITACETAINWMQRQDDEYERDTYISEVKQLNSTYADFQPALYNNALYLTSSRSLALGEAPDSWTGNQFYDLFVAETSRPGSFGTPAGFNGPVNSPYNDGSIAFNSSRTEMYFTRCGSDDKKKDDYCAIFVSYLESDDTWGIPIELKFFEDSLNLGSPCLSPDDQTLFFTATDPNSASGSDIFFSKRLYEGWDEPQNAGASVNTIGNEAFPSFGPDGTFYFSSDGIPGMGGLDLFSAKWVNGKFSKVTNMEYPINSGGDDFGITIDKRKVGEDTLAIGYFSSSRKGGTGSDDIYQFIKTAKKLKPPVFVLNGRVLRKVYEDTTDVTSRVIDTVLLPGAAVSVSLSGSNNLIAKFTLKDANDAFSLEVDRPQTYLLKATKDGFFARSVSVSTDEWQADPGDTLFVYQEIVLDQIPSSKETQIKLSNIYYDFNDTTLRPESFPELDQLVKLLTENPNLTIQINSHTDSRGGDKYNQKLSQGRANSVVVYLISKGITAERLVAKGFGESDPDLIRTAILSPSGATIEKGTLLTEKFINNFKTNKDDFEFLHQFNRRTTFNVLSDDFQLDSETPDDIKVDEAPEDEIRDTRPKID